MLLLWVRMAGPRSRPVLREPQEEAAAHGGCSEEENRLGKKDYFIYIFFGSRVCWNRRWRGSVLPFRTGFALGYCFNSHIIKKVHVKGWTVERSELQAG